MLYYETAAPILELIMRLPDYGKPSVEDWCHTWDVFSNTGMSLQISEVVSLRPLISSAVAGNLGSSPTSSATHSCPMCRFTTTCRLLLTQHIRRHHDNWPFVCPHCDYRTHRSHDLKKHLRTHTGEKPYHCNLCPYQTSDPSNLSAHLKNRHSSVRVEDQVLLPLWWGFDRGSKTADLGHQSW